MSELISESTSERVPGQRMVLPLSDAVRASLLAVRAAQETAQRRARRETRWARLWLGGIVVAIVVGVLALGRRDSGHAGSAKNGGLGTVAATGTPGSHAATAVSTPMEPGPGSGSPAAASSNAGPTEAGRAASAPALPSTSAAASSMVDATSTACTATFGQRRWRVAIEMCTRAFDARPMDAGIALRVAQAQHARGRLPEAGEWANRVIALDPSLPEAFVIVAHAEAHAGHPGAAADAYRRYLALAPRGWHAAEARGALRAHARDEHARTRSRNPLSARTVVTSSLAAVD
jgi:tetratricopeptide (TPR) repeat protein